ncbi:shikimate kinase [Nibrella saemangeumensis]|uniref:Shikimate kinase n=1 Tax=Nibrella saemangeumensis TaxID=1084526 RepID=A0ABP8ND06_9BACT
MKNIFLIGMPSSGKSTIGKQLARELHYRFTDTDKLIVRQEGRSINDIFAQEGEDYFRRVESEVLHSIRPGSSLVVATGGGAPCFHNNMAYIKATGISVFLDVEPEVLLQRMMAHAIADRPLYQQNDPALLENLRKKYTDRLPFYSQATIIMSGETTAGEIMQRLGDWL